MNALLVFFGAIMMLGPNIAVAYAMAELYSHKGWYGLAAIAFLIISVIPLLRWPIMWGVAVFLLGAAFWKTLGVVLVVAIAYHIFCAISGMGVPSKLMMKALTGRPILNRDIDHL